MKGERRIFGVRTQECLGRRMSGAKNVCDEECLRRRMSATKSVKSVQREDVQGEEYLG